MSTWIQANGTVTVVEPENGSTYNLKELDAFVGGFIEIVYLSDEQVMVLNEEGKLNDLPFNALATKLAHATFRDYSVDDYIVGDVLVCQADEIE